MTEPLKIKVPLKAGDLTAIMDGKELTLDSGMMLAGVVPVHIIIKREDLK